MRICIAQNVNLTDYLGLSTYLRNITEFLASLGKHEIILISQKGHYPNDTRLQNVSIHEINSSLYSIYGNLRYSLGLYKKLKEINQSKPIDIIHCNYPNSSLLGAALFKRSSPNTKIVYDIRSPWIDMSIARGSINKWIAPVYRKTAYFSENVLSRYVDGFIFSFDEIKKFYEHYIDTERKPFEFAPNGIDLRLFSNKQTRNIRNEYGLSQDNIVFGYVGGIARMRQLDFVLHTFKVMSNPNYKLMFVGDGDDRLRLQKMAEDLKIQKDVIFTGSVPYEVVPDYMSLFDIGLCHLPDTVNFRYSFPMKIIEYLACGVPVLASEIITHVSISKKLPGIHLYNSSETFISKAEKVSNDRISNINLNEYNWETVCKKITGLYEKTLVNT